MSSRLLTRFALALGVLVVVWGLLALVRRPPEDRSVSLTLAKVDTAAVDSIVLARQHDTATVTRSGKRWSTNGFPADSEAVASFLSALADTARTSELVAENESSHERLGVAPDSALHVTVHARGASRPGLDLMAGGRTSDYAGVFVRRPNEDAVYALGGRLYTPLTRPLDDWRDKRIVAVTADSVGRVEVQRGARSYSVSRSGASWALAPGKPADSTAVTTLLSDYRDLRASGFPTRAQADSVGFATPKARVRLVSRSGKPLVDLALDSTVAGTWVRPEPNGIVYEVDSWLWGRLAPAESTLAVRQKPAPGQARKK